MFICILCYFSNNFHIFNLSSSQMACRLDLSVSLEEKLTHNQIWQGTTTVYAYYYHRGNSLHRQLSIFHSESWCITVLKMCGNILLNSLLLNRKTLSQLFKMSFLADLEDIVTKHHVVFKILCIYKYTSLFSQ